MKVLVLGAGAMGSWLGALLSGRHDVTLVTRRADHLAAVNATGLKVTGKTELEAWPKAVRDPREADVPDLLLVTTKAYDTSSAIQAARPVIGARTRALSLQNGLGNLEKIAPALPEPRILVGATTHGVTYQAPGHVHHAGVGYTVLGSPVGETGFAHEIAEVLAEAGLEVQVSENVLGEVWAKVVVNAGINPLTAITGLRNGALLEIPYLREIMQRSAEEAIDVAKAEGVKLPDDDLHLRTRRVAELTAENKSSMLQDVERGRPTEIDAISGEIVERGLALGIDTPVNLTLRALVKGIEETTRR